MAEAAGAVQVLPPVVVMVMGGNGNGTGNATPSPALVDVSFATSTMIRPSKFTGRFIFNDPGTVSGRAALLRIPKAHRASFHIDIRDAFDNTLLFRIPPMELEYDYGIHFSTREELVDVIRRLHSAPGRLARFHEHFAGVDFAGDYMEEYNEQILAASFISPNAMVLELGANVGRNTSVIGMILRDPSRLVAFETSHFEACAARLNLRKLGLGRVHVETAAVSSIRLQQSMWLTRPIPPGQTHPDAGWTEVKTIPYREVVRRFGSFDTLVADCEGALLFILRDAPEILDTVRLVITENDYKDLSHYEEVSARFISRGLRKVVHMSNSTADFPTRSFFYEAWTR